MSAPAPTPALTPAVSTPPQTLSRFELISIITTAALFVILAVVAWLSSRNQWLLALAFSVGGLGGLVHEIAQSRGRILFFKRQSDGLYLGSIAGIILGAVAGILVIRGYLTGDTASTNATF